MIAQKNRASSMAAMAANQARDWTDDVIGRRSLRRARAKGRKLKGARAAAGERGS